MTNLTTASTPERMKPTVYIWCPRCPNGTVQINYNEIGACDQCGLEYQAAVQITALDPPTQPGVPD